MNPQRLTIVTLALIVVAVAAFLIVPRFAGDREVGAELDLAGQPGIGSEDAPVEVVLFEDFLCPHCATFTEQVYPRLRSEYVDTGQVRLYYVNFPVIPGAEGPAQVGECVYRQSNEAFWELKAPMFRSQAELRNDRRLLEVAETYAPGIDPAELETCVEEEAALADVRDDAALAQELGLTGTPSVLVDGVRVANPTLAGVTEAIDRALAAE